MFERLPFAEKNAFEWAVPDIPHSEDAVRVTQAAANFFVKYASKSRASRFFLGSVRILAGRSRTADYVVNGITMSPLSGVCSRCAPTHLCSEPCPNWIRGPSKISAFESCQSLPAFVQAQKFVRNLCEMSSKMSDCLLTLKLKCCPMPRFAKPMF